MARGRISLVTAALLLLVLVTPALAADGCPAAASGFQAGAVNWEWEVGDPIPTGDLLWEVTVVQGAAEEGLTVEQLAQLFGLATSQELYGLVLEGWRGLDRNMDGAICFKEPPLHQNGLPAYLSNFVDTNAATSR